MAKQLTSLTIFVSGPSDSEAEKGALRAIVAEISQVLEKTHHVTLRLIEWPESIHPGAGTDPQSVVNRQVGDNYDIYIGILAGRFGQPTPRAESGTEEEFNRALGRFWENTSSVRVLFYFNRSPVDLFSLDSAQVAKVQQFRQGLGPKGVLSRDFKDTADFASQARGALHNLIVDEWRDGRWTDVPIKEIDASSGAEEEPVGPDATVVSESLEPTALPPAPQNTAGEEFGLLELLDEFSRATEAAGKILERIGQYTVENSGQLDQRTDEMNKLLSIPSAGAHATHFQAQYLRRARSIAEQSATDLDRFASNLNLELQNFRTENRAMFDSLGRLIEIQQEFPPAAERLSNDRDSLVRLVATLTTTRDTMTTLQGLIARIPALVGSVKRARKRLSGTLGELIAEFQFAIQEASRIVEKMRGDDGVTS